MSNDGEVDAEVVVSIMDRDPAATIEVTAGQTVLLGPRDTRVRLADMPQPPGATVEMTFASPEHGTATLELPVLDDTFERYEELVPTSSGR
ncbi:hypothetical protein SAMN05421867_1122 [Cellulomonas marina]|uniref:Uncharacterized protein n=1 Tax=Cellulomonas marina TaxID=988821 RepID=A0A1I0ZS32_9CELL|nr:hypothetical protein SAMN05421867_1122 [Cellulomonas marina]